GRLRLFPMRRQFGHGNVWILVITGGEALADILMNIRNERVTFGQRIQRAGVVLENAVQRSAGLCLGIDILLLPLFSQRRLICNYSGIWIRIRIRIDVSGTAAIWRDDDSSARLFQFAENIAQRLSLSL